LEVTDDAEQNINSFLGKVSRKNSPTKTNQKIVDHVKKYYQSKGDNNLQISNQKQYPVSNKNSSASKTNPNSMLSKFFQDKDQSTGSYNPLLKQLSDERNIVVKPNIDNFNRKSKSEPYSGKVVEIENLEKLTSNMHNESNSFLDIGDTQILKEKN